MHSRIGLQLLLAAMLLVIVSDDALARPRRRRFGQSPAPATAAPAARTPMPLVYPATKKVDQIDDYHGTKVADPYRWLEDPDSPDTRAWVAAQNKVTFDWLAQIPSREPIRQRLTSLWNYQRYGQPHKRGGRYFYSRNDGLQNQSAVYVVESLDARPRLLFDPNTLAADGTIALKNWAVSDDGKLMAYGLAAAGSDWEEWGVLNVDTGRLLPDKLQWVKFSRVSWTPDNQGFYYSRYDQPPPGQEYTGQNYYQKLYYHRLGQPQEQDTLVYERNDQKEWGFDGEVTEDGRYLVIVVWRGTEEKNLVFYQDLQTPGSPVVELISEFEAEYNFLGNDGPLFWLLTDLDAPLRRVIAIDTTRPQRANWREVIPQSRDTLRAVNVIGDHFVASYLKDAASAVKVFDLAGKHVRDVALPGLGSVGGFGGRRDDSETFYNFTSYTNPGSIYRYDVKSGENTLFREPKVDFDPERFETKQIFFKSKDGTRVPMMIVSRKGLVQDGTNPTVLFAYGGFNNALTPSFAVSTIAWLEMGGVYAVANLRGGGEYGREWHEAGMLDRKQNVFDDFLAAAEWLVANKYTSPEKLAIRGGSNGGLLVGAAMTQRPDLFAAAVPAVGVMDMLRYHKFTIGWAWVSEYGSADEPAQFKSLLAYSPLHNLRPGTAYPATLVTTADHDDRVVPGHSLKFAAALQAAHAGSAPVLIRIETRAGHGASTPTTKLIDQAADVLAFLTAALKMPRE
ncbi:MAG: prolyl oligopeptidase family serine peptidase [Planctomycetaceae bacterium]|nr:prolyl oligopeptidase family serine peptidase [Planctomycetaceae bacterium]